MAFDPGMAEQMRSDLGADVPALTEQKMFGGLCFLTSGNMIGGVGPMGALYRVGKDAQSQALSLPDVTRMEMGGRVMGGFVRLGKTGFADDATRRDLTRLARDFATGLPPKAAK